MALQMIWTWSIPVSFDSVNIVFLKVRICAIFPAHHTNCVDELTPNA